MPDSAPGESGQREPRRNCGAPPESGASGLTEFLAVDPADAGLSREALRQAVRLLIRERDYLRNVRDIQIAEARAQAEDLARDREALREDRDAWRERATKAEDWLPRRLSGWVKRILLGPLRRGR